MTPAPTVPVALTAAELRALAAVHDDFANVASVCGQHAAAAESWDRAQRLRCRAAELGPPAGDDASLLSVGVQP